MVIFFATDSEIFARLSKLAKLLAQDSITSKWKTTSYHGKDTMSLEVYAHGNTVAPYLRTV